jgi:uncharacterized protein YbcI
MMKLDQEKYMNVTAHNLIADLCVGMAQEVVEELYSRHNEVYSINKNRIDLVRQIAPTLKAEAKKILGTMLGDPNTSDSEKERIYEALILDNQLPHGGTSVIEKRLL